MKAYILISCLGLILSCCSTKKLKHNESNPAQSHQFQRTASIVHLQGQVLIKRSGAPDWIPATKGMELRTNDKVRTHRESFATIRFEQGGLMRIEPESLMAITDLLFEQRTKINRSTFSLEKGRVEAELHAMGDKKSSLKIKTPSAEATLATREVAFQ